MIKKNILKKKYIKRLVPAFTMAEILISLMISSVLVAAMVPIVGVKKVKRPTVRPNHGVAECYYSGGQLKAYLGTGRRAEDVDFKVSGDHCELVVPQARYMQVYVIGAGGNSGGSIISSVTRSDSTYTGNINIGNTYQEDIAAAENVHVGLSDMIRNALNSWSGLNAVYTVTSPMGSGGAGKCHAELISNSATCNSVCANGNLGNGFCKGPLQGSDRFYSTTQAQNSNTGDYCWAYIHGRGQASGTGLTQTFSVPINANSQMNITEDGTVARVAVLNNSSVKDISLLPSGNGSSPVLTNSGYEIHASTPASSRCTSGSNSCAAQTVTATPGSDGGMEPVMGFGCTDYITANARGKAGKVEYTKPTLTYTYSPVVFRVSQPYGGKPGNIVTNVYEKMAGTLYLYPAQNNGRISYIKKKGASSFMLSAISGVSATTYTENIDVSRSELPVVMSSKKLAKMNNEYKLDNAGYFEDYLSKINSMVYDGGLKNCQNNDSCPGFAGNGPYLYLEGSGLKNINTLTITNNQPGGNSYTHKNDTSISSNASGCDSGDTKQYLSSSNNINVYYCKPGRTTGNPGAVIIVW